MPIHDKEQQKLHDKHVEWAEEEKTTADDAIKGLHVSLSDEIKNIEAQQALFELYRNRVLNDFENLFKIVEFKIVKYVRVFQIGSDLSGILREDVVEDGTNMIHWKKAKKFLNEEFKNFLAKVKAKGPNENKPKIYAKTLKLEKYLQRIPFEEVQNYSLSLSLLYKFLEQFFKLRVLDVTFRRKEFIRKTEQREAAIKASEELEERKSKHLNDAKEAFEKEIEALEEGVEKPFFDTEKILQEFSEIEGNKPIEIPDELVPDEDGDLDWTETNP